ncbi:hypothetical protein DOTSEDRAFT_36709 [Dothistroma septosporum NZE10]|uniref:Uncharacterized protein n=1 Tax=Dothistroma septosporum (strain NZE10 / CBS 128990) TaxID=675120 RepID=N1PGP0_DOTSN|nr:hypothetical protein DOTSEDRAFT_36709 [Dothistroma septosporum NZE10]
MLSSKFPLTSVDVKQSYVEVDGPNDKLQPWPCPDHDCNYCDEHFRHIDILSSQLACGTTGTLIAVQQRRRSGCSRLVHRHSVEKRSKDKQRELLRRANPDLSAHRDIDAFNFTQANGAQYDWQPSRNPQYRLVSILPYLATEPLASNAALLFALTQYRIKYTLEQWATFDITSFVTHGDILLAAEFNPWCVIMHGSGYGNVVPFEQAATHRDDTVGYPRAHILLEAQPSLMDFLFKMIELAAQKQAALDEIFSRLTVPKKFDAVQLPPEPNRDGQARYSTADDTPVAPLESVSISDSEAVVVHRSKRALEVFKEMFATDVEDSTQSSRNSAGSAVVFGMPESGRIVFHRPHPTPKIDPIMLRAMGKRLRKWFGFGNEGHDLGRGHDTCAGYHVLRTHTLGKHVRCRAHNSLEDFKLDFMDLSLMQHSYTFAGGPTHLPREDASGKIVPGESSHTHTWRAAEKLLTTGKVRAVGITNFSISRGDYSYHGYHRASSPSTRTSPLPPRAFLRLLVRPTTMSADPTLVEQITLVDVGSLYYFLNPCAVCADALNPRAYRQLLFDIRTNSATAALLTHQYANELCIKSPIVSSDGIQAPYTRTL